MIRLLHDRLDTLLHQLHVSTVSFLSLSLALGLLLYATQGTPIPAAEWQPVDIVGEGGVALLAGFWAALVARSRQEAATVQDGANHYAEQVLGELEGRLQELSQVVLGGRQELGRLMATQITASERQRQAAGGEGESSSRPASRSRRVANRLRAVAEKLS